MVVAVQKITFWNNLMPTATTDHGPSLEAETKAQTANNCSAPTEPKSAAAATATAKVIHYKDGVFSNLNAKPEVIRIDELSYEDKPPVSEKKCKLEDQQLTAIVFCFLFSVSVSVLCSLFSVSIYLISSRIMNVSWRCHRVIMKHWMMLMSCPR